MPRIDAPTVVEHRARQRRALLDAARELLAETGEAPSMAAVGRRAGLARSSLYQYFPSTDALLQAVVADVFPSWAEQVRRRVLAAQDPGNRIWAYIVANVELFTGPEQAVARALARVVDPTALQGPMQDFHAQLQVPLREALTDLGEPEVATMAEMIDAITLQAARTPDTGADTQPERGELCFDVNLERDQALRRLRRLISGYLGIPSTDPAQA